MAARDPSRNPPGRGRHRWVGGPGQRRTRAAPPMARDIAATIGPMAHASAMRAEIEAAEPDDLYVARQRADFEAHMRQDHLDLTWVTATRPSDRPVSRRSPAAARAGAEAGSWPRTRRSRRRSWSRPRPGTCTSSPAKPTQPGHADGYRAGYRQADADQAARWNQAAGAPPTAPPVPSSKNGDGDQAAANTSPTPAPATSRPRPPAPARTRNPTRNGGNPMTDTGPGATRPSARPSDPAMAASDPGMLAALSYDGTSSSRAHGVRSRKANAVYDHCPNLESRKSARSAGNTRRRARARQAASPAEREPEAGQ